MDSRRRTVALLVLTLGGAAGVVLGVDASPPPTVSPPPGPTVGPPPTEVAVSHRTAADAASERAADPSVLMVDSGDWAADVAWIPGQLLVRAPSGEDLDALAAELQATVVHSAAVDGLGVLVLADGMDVAEARRQLADHPGVEDARPHGLVRAAHRHGRSAPTPAEFRSAQWHLDHVDAPNGSASWRTWVAVLDTGMAYASGNATTSALGTTRFKAAETLRGTPLVDPWDYLLQIPYPLDEHQHGTHITSLIASRGAVDGVAPGVAVLPYKILDAYSQGSELALIDALYWTVWADADVVNLSLGFAPGYEPSDDLLEALGYVDAAGLVMVAAAGNHASVGSTWPAVSPQVISVGASCLEGQGLGLAPYSNVGGDVDLLAPGGCLDRDVNQDGHPDGILGESFRLNEPGELGWFWFEGTSQAAALVSAAAGRLLEAGARADEVRPLLQLGATHLVDTTEGTGTGSLGISAAISALGSDEVDADRLGVVVVPWRRDLGGQSAPAARIFVVDDDGAPVDGAVVTGHFKGSTASTFACETSAGSCDVEGDASGDHDVGWTVTVGAVGTASVRLPPRRAALVDATTAAMMDALADHLAGASAFDGGSAPVGWYDPGTDLGDTGTSAPAFTFVGGSGVQTSPFGVIASPGMVAHLGTTSTEVVGSGVQTSPFGLTTITLPGGEALFALEGSGVQTSPFGVLPPGPGSDSCIGQSSCDTSVVLDSGATVGMVSGASAGAVMGASTGLELVGACVTSETFGETVAPEAMMHDAVEFVAP